VSPARLLNTPFQPSLTNQTWVTCSVSVFTTIQGGVGLGAVGRVELRSDAVNPPTTVRASSGSTLTSVPNTVPAGESFTTGGQWQLSWIVPAGDFVELVGVPGQDAPVFTLDISWEIPIG
jgi:hypothetical protein